MYRKMFLLLLLLLLRIGIGGWTAAVLVVLLYSSLLS